jgi:hypothetical protein
VCRCGTLDRRVELPSQNARRRACKMMQNRNEMQKVTAVLPCEKTPRYRVKIAYRVALEYRSVAHVNES